MIDTRDAPKLKTGQVCDQFKHGDDRRVEGSFCRFLQDQPVERQIWHNSFQSIKFPLTSLNFK